MSALPIPTFTLPAQHGNALDRRLVAAIRYDYEVALWAPADIVRKYVDLVGKTAVYEIINSTLQPEVRPARYATEWLLRNLKRK